MPEMYIEYEKALARIAELEAQIQWDKERQVYLEAYRDGTDRKLGELTAELAVYKRAFARACGECADRSFWRLSARDELTQRLEAIFIKQAQEEAQP